MRIPVWVALSLLSLVPAGNAAPCRLALALGLDVSGSVDAREYRLQLDGLAAALEDEQVVGAILALPSAPVRALVFEWSGPKDQRVLAGWTDLADKGAIARLATRLRRTGRTPSAPGTALGSAMRYGGTALDRQPGCWARKLDISGDGRHNMGPHPRTIRDDLSAKGMTVNALAIGADAPRSSDQRQEEIGALSSYFRAWVITGPGAFVETALGYEAYRAAMTRKLLRELQTPVVSSVPDALAAPGLPHQ